MADDLLDDILREETDEGPTRTGEDEHLLNLGISVTGKPGTAMWRLFREDGHWVARSEFLDLEVTAKTHREATESAAHALYDWIVRRGLFPVAWTDTLDGLIIEGPARPADLYDGETGIDPREGLVATDGVLGGAAPTIRPVTGIIVAEEGIFGADDITTTIEALEAHEAYSELLPENRPLDPVICEQVLRRITETDFPRPWTLQDVASALSVRPRAGEYEERRGPCLLLHDIQLALSDLLDRGIVRPVPGWTSLPLAYEVADGDP